ncbi:MAG: B12-binding domain-containing radical SAM protein [Firmicutes bacterium]|nr:B12-binding domain-containing radical SAM protein [Bacillota bacterium]
MPIKRVLLIEPKAPASHVYSLVRMPRLGLPLLGTKLKELGYEVSLIYGMGNEIRVADLRGVDLVGISTTTSTCQEAYRIARFARSRRIPVVLGGVHATFRPEEALEHCDYVCRGEADYTFAELLECLNRGEAPLNVPGVSFRYEGKYRHNPLPEWVDINESPVPDLFLFKNVRISTYPVSTSRGCPFDCTFCSVTQMFGHRYRYRNTDLVLSELAQYKGKNVFISDDNFTANPKRAKELLQGMIERDILPKWWGTQVRTDAARDDELLDLMRRANCGTVYVGMESVNSKTLEVYNKRQDLADIELCVRKFHEYGIMVHGMFVFGSDDDTVSTIRETVDFALQNRIDTVQFLILVPLPGTPVYRQMEEENRLLTRDWNLYDGHHVVFRPAKMSPYELQMETEKAFKRFYSVRNTFKNLPVTGFRSVAFRSVGHYLVRKWLKESSWYQEFLKKVSKEDQSMAGPMVSLRKTIESFKIRRFRYLSTEKLVEMQISEKDGGILVDLQGYLNNFALTEMIRTLKRNLPAYNQKLTVNAAKLGFASEEVIKTFIQRLNALSGRFNIEVKVPDPEALMRVLERYNLSIPHFECHSS